MAMPEEIRSPHTGDTGVLIVGFWWRLRAAGLHMQERVTRTAIESFGALHILVNNAGFTWDGVIHKMTVKQWDMMLNVHCTAPFRLIQAAEPYMRGAAKKEMARGGQVRPSPSPAQRRADVVVWRG
jgi:NAD(P)-dependent dehydrogenase (short-subunit alcohol dehydrogenase family)